MTVIEQDRTTFDEALADPDNVLLILGGDEDSDAQGIHDLAESMDLYPWRRTMLLRDLSVLTRAERQKWVNSPERFASWSCDKQGVGKKGPSVDLLRRNGKPSKLRIRGAFAAAEKL